MIKSEVLESKFSGKNDNNGNKIMLYALPGKECKRAGELAFKGGGTNSTPRIHTPPEFRDLLLAIARSANKASNA